LITSNYNREIRDTSSVLGSADSLRLAGEKVAPELRKPAEEGAEQGAPLNAAEIPAKKTIVNAFAQMMDYSMLESSDGRYRVVDSSSDLLAYYAESIAHWFDGGTRPSRFRSSVASPPSMV
jgi:hypothetical protein